jgi:mono/diheme cytochrome c family protein
MRRLVVAGLVAAVLGCAALWLLTTPATVSAELLGERTPDLDNGRTIFNGGGCSSCHATPEQEDRTRLGGGRALKSPYGTFYAPNISPDRRDGIGDWTEAQFVTAMLKGTSPDGRHYYPAFPYASYQRMRTEDVRDLFGYLKTLPAVSGRVSDHELAFPFNIRRVVGAWKLLFLDGKPFTPDTTKSAEWNRGAYLVNGPAHCAECHSARNWLGAIRPEMRFAGGPAPDGDGWIPNITQKALASWTEKDFAELLETGATPDDQVSGDMAATVRNTAALSAADRAAMAVYLKSLPAVEGPKRPDAK